MPEDETTETVEQTPDDSADWQAEAEKWKALAEKNEQQAKENFAAASRAEKLETEVETETKKAAEKVAEAEALAEQARQEAVDSTSADVEEWQAEAERWKQTSRKFEAIAKEHAAAARKLEDVEATEDVEKAEAVETAEQAEARAQEAEAKALRYEVAQEMGVPQELRSFLTGNSRKEIEEQADAVLAQVNDDPDSLEEDDEPEEIDEAELAANEKLEAAERRAAEAELKALRYEVAQEHGLESSLAQLLSATDREGLVEQAQVLVKYGKKDDPDDGPKRRRPRERLRSGAVPDVEPEMSTADLASAVLKKARGY